MIETSGRFYLGRRFKDNNPLLYNPDDLTTHAVVVGMTGSGKTGLCIDLLEEAALQDIPALMVDPKGDITNVLLHFPEMLPSDFQPWLNPDNARRTGKTIEQAAAEVLTSWVNGLEEWDIQPERVRTLKNSAHFAVYTPGSDAGIPISILANLQAPEISWDSNKELLRDKISGTVTAILGLVGMDDIDPIQSQEHILLSNIFEHAWTKGRDLDLSELILQTQNPPFEKLGVFDINTFYPEKDRFELSMLLNNILAAPSFQTWLEGEPLDIHNLLYAPDGRPRHSVFYIAHLNNDERMFFVTLLYSAVETWMRAQTGTSALRAILYFDEIFGFMPPISNPPSKPLMLRMLKQSRAYGVGHVVVTQNPTDLDYKALSNAGTWFIGKLQTENDKNRLLDGLLGAAPGLDRRHYDDMISRLDKREFLLHNIHENNPVTFKTRWAMNYLVGPLTRNQIPLLNKIAGVESMSKASQESNLRDQNITESRTAPPGSTKPIHKSAPASPPPSPLPAIGSTTRSPVPAGIHEYFLPNNLTVTEASESRDQQVPANARILGLIYRPVVLAQAEIRFLQHKYNLNYEQTKTALVLEVDRRGTNRWEDWLSGFIEPQTLDLDPVPLASFETLEAPFTDGKILRAMKTDFTDWIYHTIDVNIRANETLEIYAGPEISQAEFRRTCARRARDMLEQEKQKLEASYDKKIETIQNRLRREKRELAQDKEEHSQRRMEELGTHAENVLGVFSKRRRRLSTSLSKRRMTKTAKSRVEESEATIEDYDAQISDLRTEKTRAIETLKEKWVEISDDMEIIPIRPYKKDILVDLFGIAWMPYHRIEASGAVLDLPGYS
jgi:hypothetical protein